MPQSAKAIGGIVIFFVIFKSRDRIITKTFRLKNLGFSLPKGGAGFQRKRAARDAN
jgi:hypothetical protein